MPALSSSWSPFWGNRSRDPRSGEARGRGRPYFPPWAFVLRPCVGKRRTPAVSAVPTDIPVVAEPGSGRSEALPRNARIYFVLVAAATAAATLPFLARLQHTPDWVAFFIYGPSAAPAR